MKALVLTAGIFFATSAIAGNGESLINRIVKRSVSYPEELRSKGIEASVRTTVRVLADGTLEIISIHSRSEEMKAAVAKQLQGMHIKNFKQFVGQEFSYTFQFKVQ